MSLDKLLIVSDQIVYDAVGEQLSQWTRSPESEMMQFQSVYRTILRASLISSSPEIEWR